MHTAAILGYFLAFGLMGLWHGIELHYILYGLYMATLLSAFHIFSNWKKVYQQWREAHSGMRSPFSSLSTQFASVC